MKTTAIILCVVIAAFITNLSGQDSLSFKGQVSAWAHLNTNNDLPWWNGARYIPQLNFQHKFQKNKLIDFEGSANIYGNAGLKPFDSGSVDGKIKPYRLWGRYSTEQFEFRAGLQKINFGSASILRPLMWFDQIDPRDPLKLTDGVWGALARYYFLNNVNIWAWALYGNKNTKGWESFKTKKNIPEFGGRVQTPIPHGEAGLSYHHRVADCSRLSDSGQLYDGISENRIGFDAKLDVVVGCWVEASWKRMDQDIGIFTNQKIINLGTDYTFGIGNGLTLTFEQLFASYSEKAGDFKNATTFSLLNIAYPVGLIDNVSAIIYYDWTNNKAYNFINWQRQFNKFSFYLMVYKNPKDYYIPTQGSDQVLYAGTGVQLMAVFNY